MIPREILKKIRQIELRTNRLVSETVGGLCPGVFKHLDAGESVSTFKARTSTFTP